jgi:hypothetical protein
MHSATLDTHVSSRDIKAAVASILAGRPRPLAGFTPAGIPKIVATMLEYWEGAAGYPATATGLLEYLSGSRLRLQVIRPEPGQPPAKRRLTDREQYRLKAGSLASCNWRHAVLVVDDGSDEGGMIAAAVSLVWLPVRLPFDTCTALDAGQEPAGAILGRLPGGVRREDRRAGAAWSIEEITGAEAAVTSTAALAVEGHGRVAIAEEWVLRDFAESLAAS